MPLRKALDLRIQAVGVVRQALGDIELVEKRPVSCAASVTPWMLVDTSLVAADCSSTALEIEVRSRLPGR